MRPVHRVILGSSLVILTCLLPSPPASGAEKKAISPENVVIATYGDEKVTLEELNNFLDGLPENIQAMARFRKAEMLDSLLNRLLIFRYAEDKRYGEKKAVKNYVRRARREIMIQVAIREIEKSVKPTEKELKAEYRKNKQKFQKGGKVTASHIMVMTEKEAKDLVAKLDKGSDFADLAKKYSLAPERDNGGSLGEMARGHHKTTGLPEVIETTAFSLKPGAYSGAVKSQFGWHVIYTTAKNDARQMSFGEVRPKLEKEMGDAKRSKAIEDLLAKLKSDYKIKKYPEKIE